MTTKPSSFDRPFDTDAADSVLKRVASMDADAKLPLVLSVRAFEDNFRPAMADCENQLSVLSQALGERVSVFDTYHDVNLGTIEVTVSANLARALVQEQDYFWSVRLG